MASILVILATLQQPTPASVAGTYHVTFCSAPCSDQDTALILAQGVVVLDTARLLSTDRGQQPLAGCFDITRRRPFHSYLALPPFAADRMAWSFIGPDNIRFQTYHSPDASHVVYARAADATFRGLGSSSGAGAAAIHVPDEYVVARRTAPADLARCRPPARIRPFR